MKTGKGLKDLEFERRLTDAGDAGHSMLKNK